MVIIVSPGQSIQQAVDKAAPGDTILVRAGTFHQSVTIPPGKNGIRLIGAGVGKTFLDGSGLAAQDGITVRSSFVTIGGLTVRAFNGVGVRLDSGDDVVVRSNEIARNTGDGIRVDLSQRALIKENVIHRNTGIGIHLGADAEYRYVIDNVVENNGNHGIQTAGNRTLILQNRICENDGHGIDMVGVEQWVIANSIRHNAQRGINDEDNGSTDCFIAENAVIGNGENGIHVVGIGHMLIENTVSLHTGQAPALGIAAIASHSLFFGNKSQENTGTNLIGTVAFNGNLVLANSAEKSQEEGINVTTGAQNRLLFNFVDANATAGINLSDNDGNVVDDNHVKRNGAHGILLFTGAQTNAVRSNKLKENEPFDLMATPPVEIANTFELNECKKSSPPGLCDCG